MSNIQRLAVRAACLIAILTALPACTSGALNSSQVELAYNSAGTVIIPPYTRTIFSSNNF